ncbi:MAG TPA: ArsA family ATPase [Firmicutes bacterium]|nr:ArsA family ATPase [Bacillota bacterium]
MKTYFFLGKGGVGKTTIAASFGVGISIEKRSVLVVSLDPAHNLGDAFNLPLSNKIKKISDNLSAVEVDIEKMIKEYLNELAYKMKNTYRYLTTFNLDRYFDILRHSPGIEEYAVLEAIKRFIRLKEFDTIVFDTPPTGITIRVFAMPKLSLLWTDRLIKMRRRILDRRKMVENVKGRFEAKIEEETVVLTSDEKEDDVMNELVRYRSEMEELRNFFSSEDTIVDVVTMPEELALFETKRISESLSEFKIKLRTIFLNKVIQCKKPPEGIKGKIKEQEEVLKKMGEEFRGTQIKEIPLLEHSPRGTEELKELYNNYLT